MLPVDDVSAQPQISGRNHIVSMAYPVLPEEAESLLMLLKMQTFLPPILEPLVKRLQNSPTGILGLAENSFGTEAEFDAGADADEESDGELGIHDQRNAESRPTVRRGEERYSGNKIIGGGGVGDIGLGRLSGHDGFLESDARSEPNERPGSGCDSHLEWHRGRRDRLGRGRRSEYSGLFARGAPFGHRDQGRRRGDDVHVEDGTFGVVGGIEGAGQRIESTVQSPDGHSFEESSVQSNGRSNTNTFTRGTRAGIRQKSGSSGRIHGGEEEEEFVDKTGQGHSHRGDQGNERDDEPADGGIGGQEDESGDHTQGGERGGAEEDDVPASEQEQEQEEEEFESEEETAFAEHPLTGWRPRQVAQSDTENDPPCDPERNPPSDPESDRQPAAQPALQQGAAGAGKTKCNRNGKKLRWKRAPAKSQDQIDQALEEEFDEESGTGGAQPEPENEERGGERENDNDRSQGGRPLADNLPIITYGTPRPTLENYDLGKLKIPFENIIRVCEGIIDSSAQSAIFQKPCSILQALIDGTSCRPPVTSHPSAHIATLVQGCLWAESVKVSSNLVGFLRFMHLRTKLNCLQYHRGGSLNSILEEQMQGFPVGKLPAPGILRKWVKYGSVLCLLSSAASFYILPVIACSEVSIAMRDESTKLWINLARMIRCPDPSTETGKLIVQYIIPAVELLMRRFPNISYSSMYNEDFIAYGHIPTPHILCSDLKASDQFFDNIAYDCLIKPRDHITWSSCYLSENQSLLPINRDVELCQSFATDFQRMLSTSPSTTVIGSPSDRYNNPDAEMLSPPSSPLTSILSLDDDDRMHCDSDSDSDVPLLLSSPSWQAWKTLSSPNWQAMKKNKRLAGKLMVLSTNFDPSRKENKTFPIKRKNKEATKKYSGQERRLAAARLIPETFLDMQEMIQDLLSSGVKRKNGYIHVDPNLFSDKILRINNVFNDITAAVITTMPQRLRDRLVSKLTTVLPNHFVETDSEKQDGFSSAHMVVYNRYSIQGKDTSPDQDPNTYQRQGKRKPKVSQFIPRSSEEKEQHRDLDDKIQVLFEELFEWQRTVLEELLPEGYQILRKWVDCWPVNEYSPAYPFGGYVLNVNVATAAHRDRGDLHLCFIVVISDCVGGELCLVEPGLVLGLRNGDAVIFVSSEITHLNLKFVGRRASFVFHSDKSATQWIDHRNHWGHNKEFKGSL